MKAFRLIAIVAAGLAVLLSLGGIAAASEVGANPVSATYIDGQTHPIGANAALWYRFDSVVTNSPITIKLLNGNGSGMGFEVYTAEQAATWWNSTPVGAGTTKGNDLIWVGSFITNGTFYVCVSNDKPYGDQFQLTIAGDGVMPGARPTQAAENKPAVAQVTGAANIDSYRAVPIDGQSHEIAASTSLWYRFDYSAGDRALVLLTLVNGASSGVGFNIYTADQAAHWWEVDPVGRGTASVESCQGEACLSSDLTWFSNFNLSGIYYVEVVNNNAYPATFTLTMQ